jgi:hypothetical protein
MRKLGKLKRLDVKELWGHEAHDFTPWLEENIKMLSEAVGLEIDIIDREADVGAFNVDLYGKDLNTGHPVVIENQLAQTDHSHLGQLMTYAAGFEAGVIIWISPTIRDEHRQALHWLNDISKDDVLFFGIEIEVLQIDESDPSVNFKLAVQPSERPPHTPVSKRGQLYNEFFSKLLQSLKKKEPGITTATKVGYNSWFSFGAGRGGFAFVFAFALNNKFRVELYIDTGELERNKEVFDLLQEREGEIEGAVGMPFSWERLDDRKACRIAAYHDGSIFDPPEELQSLSTWAVDTMVKFRQAFSKHIKNLPG